MHKIRAVCAVLGFVLIATVALPFVVYNFNLNGQEFPTITVYDEGEIYRHETTAQTVGAFLDDMGIAAPTSLDRINYPMEAPLYDGMDIRVNRGVRFRVITDDNEPKQMVVRDGTTVEHILIQMQDEYEAAFLFDCDLTRPIEQEETLHFLSWQSRYYTEIATIPYETVENRTDSVRAGRTYVRQAGAPGEHELTITVVYIGGYEDSRTVSEAVMITEPTTAILDIGTAPLGAIADPTASDFHYVRRVRMQATAYCACFSCTRRHNNDPLHGVTASGRRVEHGIVAVDTSVIPMGTNLYVAGYGFAVAADRGSAIVGYKIDLFMHEHADALRFGRQYVDVWILG
jgi:3D (Asp-Asp-Asp) domain-containing protein